MHAGTKVITSGGFEKKYYQFIPASAILESVSIVPKPKPYYVRGSLQLDSCDCEDDDRKFWVHNIGKTKVGER